jgi:hypothetical protein
MAVPFPGAAAAEPAPDDTSDDDGALSTGGPPASDEDGDAAVQGEERPSGRRPSRSTGSGFKSGDASGFLLGLLAWAWVILPYLQGGQDRVNAVLAAKFANKDTAGAWLP